MDSDVLFIPTNGRGKRIRVLMGSQVFGGVPKTERIGRNSYQLNLETIYSDLALRFPHLDDNTV